MRKNYKHTLNRVGIILILLLLSIIKNAGAQNTIIFLGDSVKLSLNTYRGQVTWQKAAYSPSITGPGTWTDIPGATYNNYWIKPTEHIYYRAKVIEGTCNPVVYSPERLVLISPLPGVTITTTAPSDITHNSANIAALVQRAGGNANVTARGVCWSTNTHPTIADNKTLNGNGTGSFNATLTGLQENTTYYVRGYITVNNSYSNYGADGVNFDYYTFKTPYRVNAIEDRAPEVSFTTASIKNEITFNGTAVPIQSRGVVYRSLADFRLDNRYPDLTDAKTMDGSGSGTFTTNLTGLTPGANYIYRTYATTADGKTYYSQGWLFKTIQPLTIILGGLGRLEYNRADLGVLITGKGIVTEYGLCYGLSPAPTTAGTKIRYLVQDNAQNFSSAFIVQSLTPNTKYYARPYLIDSTGTTIYGNETSFTTLPLNSLPLTVTTYSANIVEGEVITGSVIEGAGTVSEKGVCWELWEDQSFLIPTIDHSKTSEGPGTGAFSSIIKGLTREGSYLCRAYATLNNGTTIYSNYKSFFFFDFIDADVSINKIITVQHNAAIISSKVELIEGTGRGTISSRGICYSLQPNPSVADTKTNDGKANGDVQTTLTGLKPNTTYYAKAYAVVNAYGEGYSTYYSDEFSFTTFPSPLASVVTSEPTSIYNTTVSLGGKITSNEVIKERGICWSSSSNPTTAGNKIAEGAGTGVFLVQVAGLTPGSTYYAKAYAVTNSSTTLYGEEVSFTMQINPIAISTSPISGIVSNGAMSGGTIELEGGMTIIARGICYNTTGGPTINNSKTSNGQGAGSYTSTLTGLISNTIYYVRAYATDHTNKTHYGDEQRFTTAATATFQVTTTPLSGVMLTIPTYSGISGGTISGTGTISAKGVCWNTAENPTISNSKTTNGTGLTAFNSSITGLTPGSIYYYRAYATNNTGTTVYGEQYSVYYETAITTTVVSGIQGTSATSGGTIPSTVSGTITARGVCWSTTENPTVTAFKTSDGTGQGTFTSSITGLTANQTYYLRAYATLSTGATYYGNQRSFTTFQSGTVGVTTLNAVNITESSADVGGKIVGGESIQSRGICYSTTTNPTIGNNVVNVYSWSGESFTAKLIGLTANTLYHSRAFATLSNGTTIYGNQITFTATAAATFTVTTLPLSNIQANVAKGGGSYTGTGEVIDQGVTFGTTPDPVAYATNFGTSQMAPGSSFKGDVGPFQPNLLYYARAFVRSKGGQVFYGNQITFTSGTVVIMTGTSQLTGMTAKLSGYVALYGGGTITDKGICWSSTNTTPTTADSKSSQGTSAGQYSTTISGLTPSTIYAFRAYAIASDGTTLYGELQGFITRDHPTIVVENRGVFEKTTTSFVIGANIENEGTEVVTSRGICWDATNPNPTTAGNKVASGSGNGTFAVTLSGLSPSTQYFMRAYAITNTGKTVYSKVSFNFTLTYDIVSPPAPDPQEPTPPNNGGGEGGGGSFTPGVGDRYLVFGRVLGPATQNCREGSTFFSDYKGTGYMFVEGKYTRSSSVQAETSLEGQLKARFPGDKYNYYTESSGEYNANYRYAVIIHYEKKIPAWDCTSVLVTIGYGNSYDEALTHALDRKNKDINGGNKAPYRILNKLHW